MIEREREKKKDADKSQTTYRIPYDQIKPYSVASERNDQMRERNVSKTTQDDMIELTIE